MTKLYCTKRLHAAYIYKLKNTLLDCHLSRVPQNADHYQCFCLCGMLKSLVQLHQKIALRAVQLFTIKLTKITFQT